MNTSPTNADGIEEQVANLLSDLAATQGELLDLLGRKRQMIASRDRQGLNALQAEEAKLADRLMGCHQRRQALLAGAASRGLPGDSLQALAASLPREERQRLAPGIADARRRARLVQHQSLTNWVLVQRTLLHLSQMIEIIATGGQMRPTYGDSASPRAGGAFVDQAV
ncbi:MAG: flagellar export chaperone FlgN [Planctomycetota bacterium]